MGYDASCTLTIEGKRLKGTAWLEHKDLVFRGAERLVIPLARITSAMSDAGILRVRFDDRQADFDIGTPAAKWAARITNPPSRLDKLGIKSGTSVALIGVVDGAFAEELQRRGATVIRKKPSERGRVDLLFFGANQREALDRLPELIDAIQANGAIWVIRPKGQKSITEADTMAAGKRAGLVDVKVVSFSDTHTAEKFVIPLARRRVAPGRPARRSSPSR